jgi:hypothetical protein
MPLKGQCHEIFDPRFFSSINSSQGPDSRAKSVSHMALNSPRNARYLFKMVDFHGYNEASEGDSAASAFSMRPRNP